MSPEFARAQLARLDVLPVQRDGPSRMIRAAELVRVIAKFARDEVHLIAAMDRVLDSETWYPVPAVLREALAATLPAGARIDEGRRSASDFTQRGCERCAFTGYVIVQRGGFDAAERCSCLRKAIAEQPADGAHGGQTNPSRGKLIAMSERRGA